MVGGRGKLYGNGVAGAHITAGDDNTHYACLPHQVALVVAVEHGGHQPVLELVELEAWVAQPGDLHDRGPTEVEASPGGQGQEVNAASGDVLAHLAGPDLEPTGGKLV